VPNYEIAEILYAAENCNNDWLAKFFKMFSPKLLRIIKVISMNR